jgi:hypothetical protein
MKSSVLRLVDLYFAWTVIILVLFILFVWFVMSKPWRG